MMQVQEVTLILITDILAHINEIEGVRGKKPQVTLDLMSNLLFLYKEVKNNLQGESCSLLDTA